MPAVAVVNNVKSKQSYALAAIITTVALAILAGTGVGLAAGLAMGVITGLAVGVFAIFPYMYKKNVTNIGVQQQQILQNEIAVVGTIYDEMAKQFVELRGQREQEIVQQLRVQGQPNQGGIEAADAIKHQKTIELARKIAAFNNQLAPAIPFKGYPPVTAADRKFYTNSNNWVQQSAWTHLQEMCRLYIKPHQTTDNYIKLVNKNQYNHSFTIVDTISEYN